MHLKLHIERLVLDGMAVSHADRPRLQAAIEAELVRLLSAGGVNTGLQASMALGSLRAGDMHFAAGSGPDGIGRQIAGALYEGIGQ